MKGIYILLILGYFTLAGCPDTSHLLDAPDYSGISDSSGEFEKSDENNK